MKKSVEILGLPVISITEGRELGMSKTLLIDARNGSVAAITIEDEDWYRGVKLIPYESVIAIGDDAVTITNSENILKLDEASDYESLLDDNIRVIGTKAITKSGTIQGKISEVFVGDNGRIEKCEVTAADGTTIEVTADQISIFGRQVTVIDPSGEKKNDFLDRLMSKRSAAVVQEVPAEEPETAEAPVAEAVEAPAAVEEPVAEAVPEAPVVEAPAETDAAEEPAIVEEPVAETAEEAPEAEAMEATEPSEVPAAEAAAEEPAPAAVEAEESAVVEEPVAEAVEAPADIEEPVAEAEAPAAEVTAEAPAAETAAEEPAPEAEPAAETAAEEPVVEPAAEEPAVEDAAAEAQPAEEEQKEEPVKEEPEKELPKQDSQPAQSAVNKATEERHRRFLLGRKAARTIKTDNGIVIVEAGADITEEVLQKAKLANKFIELSMNVQ